MISIFRYLRLSLRNRILFSYILVLFFLVIFLFLASQGILKTRLEKLEIEEEKVTIILNDFTGKTLGLSLLLIFLGIFICFFLTKIITRPITELIEKMQRIIKGEDWNYRINIKTGDEVEELAEQFNKITEMVEKKDAFLRDLKDILEIRVNAKTRQLRELAESLDQQVKEKTKILNQRVKELEDSRRALLNILEDERKAKEIAEEERRKTLLIIQNFADGLLIFDLKEKCILVNPQAENLLEIKAKEILGKSVSDLKLIPNLQPLLKYFEGGLKKFFRQEVLLKEDKILEVTSLPIMREEKPPLGYLIVLHDITREKMIEKMKTEFVSVAAHQLRTPLSAIKWTLKGVLDGDFGEILPEQKEILEKTYKSNERLINLVNDLLNVARIEEGRYVFKPVPQNFEKIVEKILNSFKEEFEKKGVLLEFEREREIFPQVTVDEEKIELAIENLVDNALRYTPAGGKVKVSLKLFDKEIEFSIKDTGIGIPKGEQHRIFTKFFRSQNAIKMETEGSGLGLFIVKNIIEAHNGKIWFESEEGKGTTFYFRLPIKE